MSSTLGTALLSVSTYLLGSADGYYLAQVPLDADTAQKLAEGMEGKYYVAPILLLIALGCLFYGHKRPK